MREMSRRIEWRRKIYTTPAQPKLRTDADRVDQGGERRCVKQHAPAQIIAPAPGVSSTPAIDTTGVRDRDCERAVGVSKEAILNRLAGLRVVLIPCSAVDRFEL